MGLNDASAARATYAQATAATMQIWQHDRPQGICWINNGKLAHLQIAVCRGIGSGRTDRHGRCTRPVAAVRCDQCGWFKGDGRRRLKLRCDASAGRRPRLRRAEDAYGASKTDDIT
jgi:hypothetical protein